MASIVNATRYRDYLTKKVNAIFSLLTFGLVATAAPSQAAPESLTLCDQLDHKLATDYQAMMTKSRNLGQNDEQAFSDANANFIDTLNRFIELPNSLSCPLYQAQKAGLDVATSTDGRFRAISWDMLTGGTLHEFDGVIEYLDDKGQEQLLLDAIDSQVMGINTIRIDSISTNKPSMANQKLQNNSQRFIRSVYLLKQLTIGSNIMRGQSITLFEIDGDQLTKPNLIQTASRKTNYLSFGYNAASLQGKFIDSLFQVNEEDKSISFPIVINDPAYLYGKVTNKRITYKFSKGYFRKVAS